MDELDVTAKSERFSAASIPPSTREKATEPTVWDDPSSLRGPLLTEDQLLEFAVTLARTHRESTSASSARPLRKRFRETRKLIRKAYATLAEGAERKRDPSPAEVWLLDNSHVVEGQLREIDEDLPWGYLVKLPRMDRGPMRGYPLVYSLCLGYLRHTDCHLDLRSLSRFIAAYQKERVLTIGELWAVPIMLRLGLVLTVGALALSEANAEDRDLADVWSRRLLGPVSTLERNEDPERWRAERLIALRELEAYGAMRTPNDALLVTLLKRLREQDDAPVEALNWIAAQTARLGTSPEELARRYYLRQAADQVSVGNAITSMRSINNLDWGAFFAEASYVEAVLVRDPSAAYALMDESSRDRCRHAVERVARRSVASETEVAHVALEMARLAAESGDASRAEAHVGYYLVDAGLPELRARVGAGRQLRESVLETLERWPTLFYLGTIGLVVLALTALAIGLLRGAELGLGVWLVLVPTLLLATSEIAVAVTNSLVVTCVPPRLLPKYEFKEGIGPEHRTLVVVPTLLTDSSGLAELLAELEVRSLANADPHLHFALLTDFPDADVAERPGETELLAEALAALDELNAGLAIPRYFLLHRRRLKNPTEKDPGRSFLGWERKRGKLHELNRLLRGATDTSFQIVAAPRELLESVRYVITLDTDTELPLGVARRLIGAMAHPLNRPVVDAKTQRVVRGHAIVQPRVGTSPMSARRSIFARLAAGPPGIDPYTTAVSDVYQDLFGEGSFVGKGIYDVDAFMAVMNGRVPDNQLLSHDLFESIYARSALASDIEVLDEQPAAYAVAAGRQHRWTRGDWQLLPWFLPKVPAEQGTRPYDFRAFDAWRVLDNLRRSLLAPALVALAALTWSSGTELALVGTGVIAAVFIVPVVGRLLFALARTDSQIEWLGGLGGDLKTNAQQALLSAVFLLDQALVSIDAIGRAFYRQWISRQKLLEWTSMRDASRASEGSVLRVPRLLVAAALALLLGIFVVALDRGTAPFALPLLGLWILAPWVASFVSRVHPLAPAESWGAPEIRSFRRVARKTWRFFEVFVGDLDHHLPPDNYQEDPRGVVAHRTSPTNIGLYLLAVGAARDLGMVGLSAAIARWSKTLHTLERLEKREGHILNWYDTRTLAPLEPRYVSTVDSGNLAGYLWTLAGTCREALVNPLVSAQCLEAARDAVLLAHEASESHPGSTQALALCQKLEHRLSVAIEECAQRPAVLEGELFLAADELARGLLSPARDRWARSADAWLVAAERTIEEGLEELARSLPHLRALDALEEALARRPGALAEPVNERLAREFEVLAERTRACTNPSAILKDAGSLRSKARQLIEAWNLDLEISVRRALEGFEDAFDRAQVEARRVASALEHLAVRAEALVQNMDFGFLYDEERSLFSIGYNVGVSRLDNAHYDLLASEARLASLVAIAKGDVPERHWFRLGRLRAKYASVPGLLSWSGSMFEYLMPLLVTRSFPDTLLDQTYHAAIERQMEYAKDFGVPWGISEAAYNVMDLGMNYQYRAFGAPGLGLKPGLGEDLVVAPYATALAALVRAHAAAENFKALTAAGLDGDYGFYESVDFTPARLPPGRRQVVVKAFMAHHQGMTLVALSNLLTDFAMQRRFHADPRIKACALLLEERIPARAGVAQPETPRASPSLSTSLENDTIEHLDFDQVRGGEVRAHLLGQGSLSTFITAAGDGFTRFRGLDLNRFREDSVTGAGGIYLYFRDLDRQRLWSSGYLPTTTIPDRYDVIFSLDKVELQRRDGSIETSTEIVLSPEHPAEIRRVTLKNHGETRARLEMTTFTELCLATAGADVAHPAFQKMFIVTELLEARGALLAHRRRRSQHEPELWVAQMLQSVRDPGGPVEFAASRSAFLGRGGSLEAPRALLEGGALSGGTSGALDPAFVLRRTFELDPGEQATFSVVTLMASSRAALLESIELFAAPHSIPRAFELAWADARVELRHLNITSLKAHRYQRLLSAIFFPNAALRAAVNPPVGVRGRDALWSQGISGDLPIVVLRLDDSEFSELCRDLLLAHEYFRLNGVETDLVILNEEAPSYLQPVQEAVLSLIRSTPAEGHVDQRGGVFVRRAQLIAEQDLQLLLSAARVVLSASGGSLSRQLRRLVPRTKASKAKGVRPSSDEGAVSSSRRSLLSAFKESHRGPTLEAADACILAAEQSRPKSLTFDNGLGGFDPECGDYVLEIGPGHRTPQPWSNVMAGPRFGALITESGSSFTWYENSQKHRLTPWSNDPTLDPSGESFFLRDRQSGETYGLTPLPAGGAANFLVRHGRGFSSFAHRRAGLSHNVTVSVSPEDPIKVWHVSVKNQGDSPRALTIYGMVDWVLGNHRETLRVSTVTSYRPEHHAILARNPFSPFPKARAFFASTETPSASSADRAEFLGRWQGRARPAALEGALLVGKVGAGLDPGALLAVELELGPGEERSVAFVLGSGEDERQALELLGRYKWLDEARAVLGRAREAFRQVLEPIQVETPDKAFDLLTNHWLLYQVLSCRFWGRSAFYQSGGAYGFRDQLQDSMALVQVRPELVREHLRVSAARQFAEGDVQHWWHPDTGEGVRTHCSDDLVWLPWAMLEYAEATGDDGIWDETAPFLQERTLQPGEDDLYSVPPTSAESASLYEHCVRALEAATTQGPRGLPLIGAGDWNDGMSRVGIAGRGESVWLGWFLGSVLVRFAERALERGDERRANWCRAEAARIGAAIDEEAWDGAWYRRAFFDGGEPLGSQENEECRIDAIAQSWSVLSRLGRPERARRALDSSLEHLLDRRAKMLLLLHPPFEGKGPDPGYIAAYPPGIRENGGQYTHGVLWTVRALLEEGRGDDAHEVLALLNPIAHTTYPEELAVYQVEPYAIAADVYSHPPHVGRGGWTWYTGSASWMYRLHVEGVLGLVRRGSELVLSPCVPSSWRSFKATYRTPGGGRLLIDYDNSRGVNQGVEKLVFDGRILSGNRVPFPEDASDHHLQVVLGGAVATTSVERAANG